MNKINNYQKISSKKLKSLFTPGELNLPFTSLENNPLYRELDGLLAPPKSSSQIELCMLFLSSAQESHLQKIINQVSLLLTNPRSCGLTLLVDIKFTHHKLLLDYLSQQLNYHLRPATPSDETKINEACGDKEYFQSSEIIVFENLPAREKIKNLPHNKFAVVVVDLASLPLEKIDYPSVSMNYEPEVFFNPAHFNYNLKKLLALFHYQSSQYPTVKDFMLSSYNFTPVSLLAFIKSQATFAVSTQKPFNYEFLFTALKELSFQYPFSNSSELRKLAPQKNLNGLILESSSSEIEDLLHRLRTYSSSPQFIQRLRPNISRMIALFSGPPGTGKSAVAEALAKELGRPLWILDLNNTFSKYVGETEKLFTKFFKDAERAEAVLLIDEAEQLLRTREGDAPVWQLQQTNHLLNLFENYQGILFLTSNNTQNIDPAFKRRIDYKINFELPSKSAQERILRMLLSPDAKLSEDFDFKAVLEDINLSGGFLRNAVERAYYQAERTNHGIISSELLRNILKELQTQSSPPPKVIGIRP